MTDRAGLPDLAEILPGLAAATVVRHTAKSVVLFGEHGGRQVAVKVLLEKAQEWRDRFAHEIEVYRAFATHPPPFRSPALVLADERSSMLVLERIEGRPLAEKRYPGSIAPVDVEAALDTVTTVNRWAPPPGPARVTGFDYVARLAAGLRQGLIKAADADRLELLLDRRPADEMEFCHGDALLSNFIAGGGRCDLLDWEFAGLYLPGFDLALLWTVLRDNPLGRRRIEAAIDAGGGARREAFVINLSVVLARELRIHRELPHGGARARVLAGLQADMADVGVLLAAATC
jgi:hypothetical protein